MDRIRISLCALALLPLAFAVRAEDATPTPAATVDLARLQVGVKSPPLWLFSKGDKKLVILGTQLPLPESGVLVTASIQDYIRRSDVVLTGPGIRTGEGGGLLRGLTLASSMRSAQKNEGGRTLREVLPADTYGRWQQLKATYIGKDAGIERQRPMYAAYALYSAALKRNGLTDVPSLGVVIAKATRDAGLQRIDARYALADDDLRRTLKQFEVPAAADVGCMQRTLDALEAYLQYSPGAAEAWAVGDVRRYRDFEQRYQPIDGCWARLTNEAMGRGAGVDDPYGRVESTWLSALHAALQQHETVFSTLPARDLIEVTGLAKTLRDEGYSMTSLFVE